MSAGLPVLVSSNSGFGKALRSAAFGSSFVIDSEDPAIWTLAIQNIWSKDRECRLEEAVTLRDSYGRKYNWAKQIKESVDKMISLTHGRNLDYHFFNDALSGNDRKTKTNKNTIPYKFCPEILEKTLSNTYLYADIRKTVTFVISSGILFSAELSMEGVVIVMGHRLNLQHFTFICDYSHTCIITTSFRPAHFVLTEDSLKARSFLEIKRKAFQRTEGMAEDLKGFFFCSMRSKHFRLLLTKREMRGRRARAGKNLGAEKELKRRPLSFYCGNTQPDISCLTKCPPRGGMGRTPGIDWVFSFR